MAGAWTSHSSRVDVAISAGIVASSSKADSSYARKPLPEWLSDMAGSRVEPAGRDVAGRYQRRVVGRTDPSRPRCGRSSSGGTDSDFGRQVRRERPRSRSRAARPRPPAPEEALASEARHARYLVPLKFLLELPDDRAVARPWLAPAATGPGARRCQEHRPGEFAARPERQVGQRRARRPGPSARHSARRARYL